MTTNMFGARPGPAVPGAEFGVNEDAKKAMTKAFDAMSNWRNEIAAIADRNSTQVFDRMGDAAKAVGWPGDFVEMTKTQMHNASKMQLHAMDQVMDAWEHQVKNPGAGFQMPAAMMEQMKAFQSMGPGMMGGASMFPGMGNGSGNPFGMPNIPGMPNFGAMTGMGDMSKMPMAPLQFWMQAAEMWQKSWQQALSSWMEAQANMMGKGGGKT